MSDDVGRDTALIVGNDDVCQCGWERPKELDFLDIDPAALPPELHVMYRCPRCGLDWVVGFEKTN